VTLEVRARKVVADAQERYDEVMDAFPL